MRFFALAFVVGTLALQQELELPRWNVALLGIAAMLAMVVTPAKAGAQSCIRLALLIVSGALIGYGLAALRAEWRLAETLPLEFRNFSDTLAKYLKELAKLADDMREETKEKNRLIAEKSFQAVSDPTKPDVAPNPESPI